jgi:hypothetical protein
MFWFGRLHELVTLVAKTGDIGRAADDWKRINVSN